MVSKKTNVVKQNYRSNKEKLKELEIASRILNNLQEARKNGIFGLKDNREANMDMIDERIDKLIEFIASEDNDIELSNKEKLNNNG